MQPQVRDLNALIAELGKGTAGQKAQIDSDILRSEQSGAAQEQGLAAAQNREFGKIEQRASDKGMLFSGFSPDAQAEYTSTTYLPALAKLQEAIASTRAGLLGKKIDIDADVYGRAVGLRESDIAAKRNWDISEADRIAREREAERNRQFEAQQNALKIAAERSSSSGGGGGGVTAAQSFSAALGKVTGKDGYVGPGDYTKFKNQWISSGAGSAAQFDATFSSFRNPKNKAYKLG